MSTLSVRAGPNTQCGLPVGYGSQWKRAAKPPNFCHNEHEPIIMLIELDCTAHVTAPRTASPEDIHYSALSSALLDDVESLIAEDEKEPFISNCK